MATYREIADRAVKEVAEHKAVILDVRELHEWDDLHAKGARHFDIRRLEAGEKPDMPEDTKVYTYCQAGGRAGRSVIMLKNMGFTDVTSMGGLNDWRAAGGEVE